MRLFAIFLLKLKILRSRGLLTTLLLSLTHDIAVIVDAYTRYSLDIKLHLLDYLKYPRVTFKDYHDKKESC